MKKLTLFFLLAIFLYNQAGYFIAFKWKQLEVQGEMQKRIKDHLPSEQLTVIRITGAEKSLLDLEDGEQEFMYNGRMYDVVRKEVKEGITFYYCMDDIQEEELFADLDDHVKKHMNDDPVKGKQDIKFVKDYFLEDTAFSFAFYNKHNEYTITSEAAASRCIPPAAQPPELI